MPRKASKVTGGHVMVWRKTAFAKTTNNAEAVKLINEMARADGYNYTVSEEKVAQWRKDTGSMTPTERPSLSTATSSGTGDIMAAIPVAKQLLDMVGEEEAAKLLKVLAD